MAIQSWSLPRMVMGAMLPFEIVVFFRHMRAIFRLFGRDWISTSRYIFLKWR